MTPPDDALPGGLTPRPVPPPAPGASPEAGQAALASTVQTLARELLNERRTDRRWRVFFRLSWLLLVLALLWLVLASRNHHSRPTGPHTALVELRGEISADSEASAEQMMAGLRNAFEDKSATAVVLRINSPGGSPVQSGLINDEIHRLKALHAVHQRGLAGGLMAGGARRRWRGAGRQAAGQGVVGRGHGCRLSGAGAAGASGSRTSEEGYQQACPPCSSICT